MTIFLLFITLDICRYLTVIVGQLSPETTGQQE